METNQSTSSGSAQPIKRPRGRPRKHPLPQVNVSTSRSSGLLESGLHMANTAQPDGSNPRIVSATASPEPADIPISSTCSQKQITARADSMENRQGSPQKTIIPPARRSSRQATIQSTQISEGTLRPPGPSHLEAALSIALANLESETWGYLARYLTKNKQGPLPTPAQMKTVSATIRRAAAAVDRADKELKDAVDEIMRENAKKKRRGAVPGSKYVEQPIDSDPSTRSSTPAKEALSREHSVVTLSKQLLASNEEAGLH